MEEVIIATNFTAEGEVTAHMIAELLKERGLKVTRIARACRWAASWSMSTWAPWRRRCTSVAA